MPVKVYEKKITLSFYKILVYTERIEKLCINIYTPRFLTFSPI